MAVHEEGTSLTIKVTEDFNSALNILLENDFKVISCNISSGEIIFDIPSEWLYTVVYKNGKVISNTLVNNNITLLHENGKLNYVNVEKDSQLDYMINIIEKKAEDDIKQVIEHKHFHTIIIGSEKCVAMQDLITLINKGKTNIHELLTLDKTIRLQNGLFHLYMCNKNRVFIKLQDSIVGEIKYGYAFMVHPIIDTKEDQTHDVEATHINTNGHIIKCKPSNINTDIIHRKLSYLDICVLIKYTESGLEEDSVVTMNVPDTLKIITPDTHDRSDNEVSTIVIDTNDKLILYIKDEMIHFIDDSIIEIPYNTDHIEKYLELLQTNGLKIDSFHSSKNIVNISIPLGWNMKVIKGNIFKTELFNPEGRLILAHDWYQTNYLYDPTKYENNEPHTTIGFVDMFENHPQGILFYEKGAFSFRPEPNN